MTTAIVVMFSLEIAATLLLLGAQVIAEYERVGLVPDDAEQDPMTTAPDAAR
jgi:membrane protein